MAKKADAKRSAKWEFDIDSDESRYHARRVESRDDLRSFVDKNFSTALIKEDAERRNLFRQSSACFGQHFSILADCRDRNQLSTGLFLALDTYDAVCFHQLQLYRDLIVNKKYTPLEAFKVSRFHKGHLLWEIVKMLDALGYEWLKRRYILLTLAEDMLSRYCFSNDCNLTQTEKTVRFNKPQPEAELKEIRNGLYENTGCAELLVNEYHLSKEELIKIEDKFFKKLKLDFFQASDHWLKQHSPKWILEAAMFPEWVIGRVDLLDEYPKRPVKGERDFYLISRTYFHWLWYQYSVATTSKNRNLKGMCFEEICGYLARCVPGVKVFPDSHGVAGQTDLIIIVEGALHDFRDACGPHIIAECKSGTEGAGKANVAELIGKSVIFNSHILFSIDSPTIAGETLEYVSMLRHDRSFMHFELKDLMPSELLDRHTKGNWEGVKSGFEEQLRASTRFSLADVTEKLPAVDFLSTWRNHYEQSKIVLYRRTQKAQSAASHKSKDG